MPRNGLTKDDYDAAWQSIVTCINMNPSGFDATKYTDRKLVKFVVKSKSHNDATILHMACSNEDVDFATIKWLIDNGASVSACDENGDMSLHLIIRHHNGRKEAVNYALQKASIGDLNKANRFGDTVLHECGRAGLGPLFVKLVESSADPIARNGRNRTPIHEFVKTTVKKHKTLKRQISTLKKLTEQHNAANPATQAARNGASNGRVQSMTLTRHQVQNARASAAEMPAIPPPVVTRQQSVPNITRPIPDTTGIPPPPITSRNAPPPVRRSALLMRGRTDSMISSPRAALLTRPPPVAARAQPPPRPNRQRHRNAEKDAAESSPPPARPPRSTLHFEPKKSPENAPSSVVDADRDSGESSQTQSSSTLPLPPLPQPPKSLDPITRMEVGRQSPIAQALDLSALKSVSKSTSRRVSKQEKTPRTRRKEEINNTESNKMQNDLLSAVSKRRVSMRGKTSVADKTEDGSDGFDDDDWDV